MITCLRQMNTLMINKKNITKICLLKFLPKMQLVLKAYFLRNTFCCLFLPRMQFCPESLFFLWKIRKIFKKFVCWIFTQNAVNAESLFSVKYNKNISKICQLKFVPKMQLVLICLPRMQQVLKFLPRIVSAVIFTQNAVGAEIFIQNVK